MGHHRSAVVIRSREVGWAAVDAALARVAGLRVVGEANTVERGLELVRELRPDLLVAPAVLDGVGLRPLLAPLRQGPCPGTTVVLFAGRFEAAELAAVDAVDIDGHFLWDELSPESLYYSVAAVASGEVVAASRPIVEAVVRRPPGPAQPPADIPPLDERERQVLALLADGLSRDEVEARVGLSRRTLERVIAELQHKLDAPTLFALGAKAARWGMLG